MAFSISTSTSPSGMRLKLRSIDESLTAWGVADVKFAPPPPAAKLRPAPLTSTYTSDDLDYNSYVVRYLRRRLETVDEPDRRIRNVYADLESIQQSLDRVAKRHGETLSWDAV